MSIITKPKTKIRKSKWQIYIPEQGHWDIKFPAGYDQTRINYLEARYNYLKSIGRKRLPSNSVISYF